MAPGVGGVLVSVQVWPPSLDIAISSLVLVDKSPPPSTPCDASRKATETPPAEAELTSGVS